jgi:hypothetical protein
MNSEAPFATKYRAMPASLIASTPLAVLVFASAAIGRVRPNPSIERTVKGLRPSSAAHVKR